MCVLKDTQKSSGGPQKGLIAEMEGSEKKKGGHPGPLSSPLYPELQHSSFLSFPE
jgi:hypothetical protein